MHRPPVIADWMKAKRKPVLPDLPNNFGDSVCAWWMEMQPEGRTFNGLWLSKTGILLWEQSMVATTGANGTFLLVLAMAWWGVSSGHDQIEMDRWQTVLEDVTWALSQATARIESQNHTKACVTSIHLNHANGSVPFHSGQTRLQA